RAVDQGSMGARRWIVAPYGPAGQCLGRRGPGVPVSMIRRAPFAHHQDVMRRALAGVVVLAGCGNTYVVPNGSAPTAEAGLRSGFAQPRKRRGGWRPRGGRGPPPAEGHPPPARPPGGPPNALFVGATWWGAAPPITRASCSTWPAPPRP